MALVVAQGCEFSDTRELERSAHAVSFSTIANFVYHFGDTDGFDESLRQMAPGGCLRMDVTRPATFSADMALAREGISKQEFNV